MNNILTKYSIKELAESYSKKSEFHELFEIILHAKTCKSCSKLYNLSLKEAEEHLCAEYH